MSQPQHQAKDAAPPKQVVDASAPAIVDAARDSTATALDAGDAAADEDAGADEPVVYGFPISEFFQRGCAPCHGHQREGGVGPSLIPARLTKPKQFYFDTIKQGRPGTAMPTWGAQLSDEDIAIIVDFLFTEPELSSVIWDVQEITLSRKVLVQEADLPSEPTHAGNLDNLMLVTERDANSFAVIDGDTHGLLGHVQTGYQAHGYAFDPTSDRFVYCVGRDGWLYKIDLYTLQPIVIVRVGVDSRGLAISDDGKYVIAGNYLPNTAVILDTATLLPLRVLHTSGEDPDGNQVDARVAIVSDVAPSLVGPYFIIALKEAGQLWRIDYSDPSFPIDVVRNVGHVLHDGFLSPDNQRFFVASQGDDWIAVIDVPRWKLVDLIPTGQTPHPGSGATWVANHVAYAATVHAGEGKVSVWNIATGSLVAQIATSGPGLFIRSNDKSPYVWADAMFADPPHELTVFDGQSPDFPVMARITDGSRTLHPEFTKDAAFVYVADWDENVVRVYDAQYDSQRGSFPLVTTIAGVTTPTGIFSVQRRHETLGH